MKQAKNSIIIERGSTVFLKLSLLFIGLVVLVLGIFLLHSMYYGWDGELKQISNLKYPFVGGIGLTMIPFLYAISLGWKLLTYIDSGKAFSELSVKALRTIKFCAFSIAVIYAALLPVIYHIAQIDDAPGLILIFSAIFIGGPLIVTVAVAVLERLLNDALQIKSENDLTV